MRDESIEIDGISVPMINAAAVVVGSGAAALNGAVHLKRLGVDDVVVVTEKLGGGTSANAGSDKQTYYRLNPGDAKPDSVMSMAEDLFSGMGMHGDIALTEAALSSREFYHLVELGVPFPHDRFGNYVGYKTDHDERSRGTSAGPNTSIAMYQRLLDEVRRLNIPILDGLEVIDIITVPDGDTKCISGLVALNHKSVDDESFGLRLIVARYVVYGTGGPAGLYKESVYPRSQVGSVGIALKAGAVAQNLTESQFGIASTPFRWNLSGSYQQVIPRYFSTDLDGNDEREFLNDIFLKPDLLFGAQFLKGYQWPFDVRKIDSFGSSNIDLAVYIEKSAQNRRVFLDYTKNPTIEGVEFSIENAPVVVRDYLQKSKATGSTPVDRLREMNPPAFELFKENGTDLEREPLEIAVCHQHVNGGLSGSIWWESNIKNFFPVGECSGTHGVYRPGGSALNSGQVGSLRAALMIAWRCSEATCSKTNILDEKKVKQKGIEKINDKMKYLKHITHLEKKVDPKAERARIQERMSAVMGIVRNVGDIENALVENGEALSQHTIVGVKNRNEISAYLRNEDLMLTERAMLISALTLLKILKGGRGSFLVGQISDIAKNDTGQPLGVAPTNNVEHPVGVGPRAYPTLDESLDTIIEFRYNIDEGDLKGEAWPVKVRPIPIEESWFEGVWRDFREGKIYK